MIIIIITILQVNDYFLKFNDKYLLTRYWSNIGIPHGTGDLEAACPFCATRLVDYPGYVRLIF
jgi:hypothetical protein